MNFSLSINELHVMRLCRGSSSSYIRVMEQQQKQCSTIVCSLCWDKKVSEYRRMFTLKYVVKNDCVQSILSLFPSAEMGQHSNYLHGNKTTDMRLFIDSFFLQYNSIFNLCHFSMTPLRTITQHANDTPYTTPAKRGVKIKPVTHCRNVISSRGLFRLGLNALLQIADCPICA